jgi:hypothetical protein
MKPILYSTRFPLIIDGKLLNEDISCKMVLECLQNLPLKTEGKENVSMRAEWACRGGEEKGRSSIHS